MESLPNLGRLTMTQAQTIRFKKAIENRRRELVSEIHLQTRQIVIAESEHDPIDQVQSMHMREESASHLCRRSRVLADVDRSLQAISDGSYGICVDCEEPISLKRLETIPWAPRCLRCQEFLERQEAEERQAA
jgi:DnaK suppressor protein